MKKYIGFYLILFIFGVSFNGFCESQSVVKGFDESWIKPGIDLSEYEAIYISTVDTDNVKYDVFDMYSDDDYFDEYEPPNQHIDDLGSDMYIKFKEALGRLLPVVSSKRALDNKKGLVVDLILSGTVQDEGLLDGTFWGKSPKTSVLMDCEISDSASQEPLVILGDTSVFEITSDDVSSLRGSDVNKWYEAMKKWASDLADFLEKELKK